MNLLPDKLRETLRANHEAHCAASIEDPRGPDPVPVLKLFNPLGAATWVATELDETEDVLFGLADLGFGCPELGYFSLGEIASIRLPFGLRIERDLTFASAHPLSVWADTARRLGSIARTESALRRLSAPPLPSRDG